MNRFTEAMLIVALALTLLVPFASTAPDALEKAVESIGVEPMNLWGSLASDFFVSVTGNSFLASILSGLVGLFSVLAMVWIMGWLYLRRERLTSAQG